MGIVGDSPWHGLKDNTESQALLGPAWALGFRALGIVGFLVVTNFSLGGLGKGAQAARSKP